LTAPQQITVAIEDLVLEGTLRPGDRLPSVEVVAERFGVSVPTALGGLGALREAGVLTVTRGRGGGHRVAHGAVEAIGRVRADGVLGRPAGVMRERYAQLLQVREAQEGLTARVAATERTTRDLDDLLGVLGTVPRTLPADTEAAFDLDLRFHRALGLCTHNPLIIRFTMTTTLMLRSYSRATAELTPTDVLYALDEIAFAVERRDPDGAAAAMRRHLRRSAAFFDRPA
jgi:DNA-binding FadR family transcriptional regulator